MDAPLVAKKTTKNQLTLPKKVVAEFPGVDYFTVRTEGGRIVLEPFDRSRADEARRRLAELGISERDVLDAVAWARDRAH